MFVGFHKHINKIKNKAHRLNTNDIYKVFPDNRLFATAAASETLAEIHGMYFIYLLHKTLTAPLNYLNSYFG